MTSIAGLIGFWVDKDGRARAACIWGTASVVQTSLSQLVIALIGVVVGVK